MNVTNKAQGIRTFNVKKGKGVTTVPLRPGETQDLDLVDVKHPALAARVKRGDVVLGEETQAVSDPAPTVTYEAKHRGGGSFSIMDREGKEVVEKLSKSDADAFTAMSAEDKAAYLESRKA